ncbi:hypothetical protein TNCT1_21600 [Streptomyces sp. 1-11]|nr:hypothetical protein TNCT1_21600 [Streptomyces sp. 1-11]
MITASRAVTAAGPATPVPHTDAGPDPLTVRPAGSRQVPGRFPAGQTSTGSAAGRLSMKELTENTARPGPGGP